MKQSWRAWALVPVMGVFGCGGGGDTFEAEDQQATTQAVMAAVNTAVAQALAGGQSLREAQESIQLDATVDCASGGTVGVSGTGSSAADFDVEVTFDACDDGNVTLDGSLSYQWSVGGVDLTGGSVDASSVSVDIAIEGTVTVSGSVTGSCEFDYRVSASQSGASIEGSVCGVDAQEAGLYSAAGM